jgi:hypothetical protein
LGLPALGADGGVLGEDAAGVVEALLVQPPALTGEQVSEIGTVRQLLEPPGEAFGRGRSHHLRPARR